MREPSVGSAACAYLLSCVHTHSGSLSTMSDTVLLPTGSLQQLNGQYLTYIELLS